MIVKIEKIISCSSEHPSYPASNLLKHNPNSSWRCAKPGEMLAFVIFQLAEPSCITGLDIGNYRSCVVIVNGSTSNEPDNWIPIMNHQFMTHDEAVNGKFKDQVQLFAKKDLNSDTMKLKFDRIKVTCMQSANLKECFGLSFIILRTEVVVDIGLDVFGRFKLKNSKETEADEFKEKYLKLFGKKQSNYKEELQEKVKETGITNFSKRQSEQREPMKRPLLEKLEAGKTEKISSTANESVDDRQSNVSSVEASKLVVRSPFGDVIKSPANKKGDKDGASSTTSKKRSLNWQNSDDKVTTRKKPRCAICLGESKDRLCKICNLLPPPLESETPPTKKPAHNKPNVPIKPKKEFKKLLEGVNFMLSGYLNPERDEIRKKALKMGAKYIAKPNATNRCTHLICAFRNTPKYLQLKGHSKIISHKWIEDCFEKKVRFPWRRYALDDKEKAEFESEEEIEGCSSPDRSPDVYEQDTDTD